MVTNYALIKNGVVVNCIVATQEFINSVISSQYDDCVEYTDDMCVGPGFSWDGNTFIPPVDSNE